VAHAGGAERAAANSAPALSIRRLVLKLLRMAKSPRRLEYLGA
jgi:hypothetical protein